MGLLESNGLYIKQICQVVEINLNLADAAMALCDSDCSQYQATGLKLLKVLDELTPVLMEAKGHFNEMNDQILNTSS